MRLFSTDIDGTIFDGFESARQFCNFWESLAPHDSGPFLVYNTGRSLADCLKLVADTPLPDPQFFVCGVGTQIHGPRVPSLMEEWHCNLSEGWDFGLVRDVVARLSPARPQPPESQNVHKCSWFWEDAPRGRIEELLAAIESHGLKAQAIYSSNRDLDFLPLRANKGNALAWLAERLQVEAHEVLVAGDSGNDASMYEVAGVYGIVVANAEPALVATVQSDRVYHAEQSCAAGVIEGISHYLADEAFSAPGKSFE